MTNATNQPVRPSTVRRLDTRQARTLAELTAIFEDLQTVLRCCERLVTELTEKAEPDDVVLEGVWTTAVLAYTRCFGDDGERTRLTDDDVTKTRLRSELMDSHKALRQLREHYTDPAKHPSERFTVGASQDSDGLANGVAITSTAMPAIDDLTVRQTGALAYELSRLVDERITEQQERVRSAAERLSRTELNKLPLIEVVESGEPDTGAESPTPSG